MYDLLYAACHTRPIVPCELGFTIGDPYQIAMLFQRLQSLVQGDKILCESFI